MSIIDESIAQPVAAPAPTELEGRINSLDVLRGIAVLGILIMNIQSFSMPDAAYFNPPAYGDLDGMNFVVWLTSHVFAELKFMTIFSVLFGAGIALFCSHLQERGGSPARKHYRRMFWLMLFGLAHGILLWVGDILFWYSLSGMIAYLFWRLRPQWLLVWSLVLLAVGTIISLAAYFSYPFWPPEAVAQNNAFWSPAGEEIERLLQAFRGGWTDHFRVRLPAFLSMQLAYPISGVWRTVGMMLAGMALFKWGVLSAQRSQRFYLMTFCIGLLLGFPIVLYGAVQHVVHNWQFRYSMFGVSLFNYWGSLLIALAYISAVMLMCKNGWLSRFQKRITPVGRMAFSCYVLQTVICTTIFYGHGIGLYGHVPRWGQILIVFGVWLIVVALANAWLARFRFGPLEWLWRSLTYGKRQLMRMQRLDPPA